MTTVSLECAQALKAAWYPQEGSLLRYRQQIYAGGVRGYCEPPFRLSYPPKQKHVIGYAAPDPLTALKWLRSKEWHIWANLGPPGTGESWEAAKQEWMPLSLTGESHLRAGDPDALIIAICQRLTA